MNRHPLRKLKRSFRLMALANYCAAGANVANGINNLWVDVDPSGMLPVVAFAVGAGCVYAGNRAMARVDALNRLK